MNVDLASLPRCEVAARAGRLVDALGPAGCDALVVTNLRNVRYLCGFGGSAGLLVVTGAGVTLCTDGRYESQAPADLAAAGVDQVAVVITAEGDPARTTARAVCDAIGAAGSAPRVGLEAASITWAEQRRIEGWLATSRPGATIVPTEGLVEALRLVKDGGEVARIELAATIADTALAAVRDRLLDSCTEAEFGFALDLEMRRLGAAERSFETIVASGPNGALPHARPGARRVERGDLVVIDFGAMIDAYRSDMTRTVMVGRPSAEQRRMLDVVTAAQAAGAAAIGPGVACKDIDLACRSVIDAAGWGDRFVHGTGHGVGLDIHEAPWVNSRSAATLAPVTWSPSSPVCTSRRWAVCESRTRCS